MPMKAVPSVIAFVLCALSAISSCGQTVLDIVRHDEDTVISEIPKPDTLFSLKGKILESSTAHPLSRASVILLTGDSLRHQVSDDAGGFGFKELGPGSCDVIVSFVGYRTRKVSIELLSDTSLMLGLDEEVQWLGGVVVESATTDEQLGSQGVVIDKSAAAGTRDETIRQLINRLPTSQVDDSRNDIFIRGNPGGSIRYRLHGVSIPNPNHFAVPGTSGGPVTMISDKLVGASNFYIGALPAATGNSISGVLDLNFRKGNTRKHNPSVQLGVLGGELSSDGPLGSDSSSYLFSIRRSAVGKFQKLGFDFGTRSVPEYSDLAFNFHFPRKRGSYSFFGLAGVGDIGILISKDSRNFYGERDRDQYFNSAMVTTGVSATHALDERTSVSATLALSVERIKVTHDLVYPEETRQLLWEYDKLVSGSFPEIMKYNFREQRLSAAFQLTRQPKSRRAPGNALSLGFNVDQYFLNYSDSMRIIAPSEETFGRWRTRWDSRAHALLIQPYVQRQFSTRTSAFLLGIHSQYFTLNNTFSPVEPRLAYSYRIDEVRSIHFGVGLHSQIQSPYLYFYGVTNDEHGQPIEVNRNMNFTRSVNSVAGYQHLLGSTYRTILKAEIYYQRIFDVPVDKYPSAFSLLNTGSTFTRFYPDTLVNTGVGRNYGIELMLERPLINGYLFHLTASLYQSQYRGSDGVLRSTDLNGVYALNTLVTREWKAGEHSVLTIGIKTSFAGGRRYGVIDFQASREQAQVVYLDDHRNEFQFKPYFRTDMRISYRISLTKVKHEFVADITNIFNTRNVLRYSYVPDPFEANKGTPEKEYQLGFLPFVYYRLGFQ